MPELRPGLVRGDSDDRGEQRMDSQLQTVSCIDQRIAAMPRHDGNRRACDEEGPTRKQPGSFIIPPA